MYAYVGNIPLNGVGPTGDVRCCEPKPNPYLVTLERTTEGRGAGANGGSNLGGIQADINGGTFDEPITNIAESVAENSVKYGLGGRAEKLLFNVARAIVQQPTVEGLNGPSTRPDTPVQPTGTARSREALQVPQTPGAPGGELATQAAANILQTSVDTALDILEQDPTAGTEALEIQPLDDPFLDVGE